MNKDLERKLIDKYSYMFENMISGAKNLARYEANMTEMVEAQAKGDAEKVAQLKEQQKEIESYHPITFGFEHDDGWYDLLDELMEKIAALDKSQEIRITQIKEKFGGLRFYTEGTPVTIDIVNLPTSKLDSIECGESGDGELIHDLIEEACSRSYKICEICGEPGKVCAPSSGGWIKTVCMKHRKIEISDGRGIEYLPCRTFVNEEEVITPDKKLGEIASACFVEENDTWKYTLTDGTNYLQTDLKHKPFNKFHRGWCVLWKEKNIELVVTTHTEYSADDGYKYMLVNPDDPLEVFVLNEDELERINDDTHGWGLPKTFKGNLEELDDSEEKD